MRKEQKRKPFSWNHLVRNYYPVLFTLKLQNSILASCILDMKGCGPKAWTYHSFRETLYPYFKLYDPELSYRKVERMFKEVQRKRLERNETRIYWNRIRMEDHGLLYKITDRQFNTIRLFPLPKDVYQIIAERIYEKKGSPKFGKRIVHGVKFGPPMTIRKEYHGDDRGGKVLERLVGLEIAWTFPHGVEYPVVKLVLKEPS